MDPSVAILGNVADLPDDWVWRCSTCGTPHRRDDKTMQWVYRYAEEMLEFIRRGLERHARTCPHAPKAILMNPGNHEPFGRDELWGIPVLPDKRVRFRHFRIDCDGAACEEDPLRSPAHDQRSHQPSQGAA
jgi:hypothetical protein